MFAKIIVAFLSLILVACNNNDDAEQQDCSEAICTHNFVTITVSVKDEAGDAVVLDSFEVIDTATGENLAKDISTEEYHNDQGIYPLISDAHRIQYQNKTTTLTFKGYINDELVVNQEFEVGADCCHVSLITGNREIVLD
mgnify:CR=1 FL=1